MAKDRGQTPAGNEDIETPPRKKQKGPLKVFVVLAALLFCVYAVVDIISQQDEIEQLEQETEMMSAKIEEAKQLNDEYDQLLSYDEEEFMKRIAVEQLGYAYPNERRFYVVNGAED